MKKTILDMSDLDENLLATLNTYIDELGEHKEEELIHVLHKAQGLFGYLPHNLQRHIAMKLGLSSAKVNGVVTFYSFFNEEPTGKYTISVCMGTACFVKGADKVLDKILRLTQTKKNVISEDGLYTIKDVRCIGACGLAPVVTVNDKVYGNVKVDDVERILSAYGGDKDVS